MKIPALVFFCAFWLVSCGSMPVWFTATSAVPEETERSARSTLIARNLVHALRQLSGLDPVTTRLRMATPANRFGSALAEELERAGYVVSLGAAPESANFLDYQVLSIAHAEGPAYEFGLSVNAINLRRQYRLYGDAIKPASKLLVAGKSEVEFMPDDSIFASTVVQPEVTLAPPGVEQKMATIGEKTVRPMHNMFDTRESNYSDVFTDYDDVRQIILVFDNDSIAMGSRNKQLTRDMVAEYNEDTDVLSVIGCSHGNTAAPGDNRALALGRSSRVREELILSGINPGHVLDEGCWDGNHFDEMMPRRGVVLTLKRARAAR